MNPSKYSYAECCYHVVNVIKDKNEGNKFTAVCLLCGESIKPFNDCNTSSGWAKWRGRVLIDHLVVKHNASLQQIEHSFSSMSDLRGRDVPKRNPSMIITDLFKSKRKKNEECSIVPLNNQEEEELVVNNSSPCYPLGLGTGYSYISPIHVTQIMRVITGNIPLTWNKREAWTLYWSDILANYYHTSKCLKDIANNMRLVVKKFLQNYDYYTISFDCWSTLKVSFKAVCFFAHVYSDGKYTSFLLDVKPLTDGSSECLQKAYQEVASFYNLKDGVLFVGDSAAVNTAAFGDRKLLCFAHCLNTACSHLTSTTSDSSARVKYGLTFDERHKVSNYFGGIVTLCQVFRGSAFKELKEWFEEKKATMEDVEKENLVKPLKVCETRWIEKLQYLEWARKFGIICFRFLCCTGSRGLNITLIHECLIQLPEVLMCLNVLNNALELLVAEKKCTSHLVLPILRALSTFFESEGQLFQGEIPRLIAKSFLHELKSGCLTIPSESKNLYMCATSCCTNMCEVDENLFNECLDVSDSFFKMVWELCDERERKTFPSKCSSSYKQYVCALMKLKPAEVEESTDNPLKKALFYREGGVDNYFLIGKLHECADYARLDSLMQMSEEELDKKISELEKKLKKYYSNKPDNIVKDFQSDVISSEHKRGRKSQKDMIEHEYALLRYWKCNGLAEPDNMLKFNRSNPLQNDFTVLRRNTSDKKGCSLFNTPKTPQYDGIINEPVKRYYEACLCLASTESDCERFFRLLSLVVKKQYRVCLNGDKACDIALLKYYSNMVYYLFGNGISQKRSISSMFFDENMD